MPFFWQLSLALGSVLCCAHAYLSVCSDSRPLDQYAFDVTHLVLRWLQFQGILWLLGVSYPWPKGWLDATSWSLFANLDFYSFFMYHGTGYMSRFAHTIIIFLIFPVLSAVFYLVFKLLPRDEHTNEMKSYHRGFYNLVLLCAQLFYMPLALAFFRAFICTDVAALVDSSAVSAPTQCNTSNHYALIALAIVLGLPFLLGVPALLYRAVSKRLIVSDAFLHERYLVARETEFALGLNDLYLRHRIPLFVSYTRLWAHFRAVDCVQCLFYAAFAVLLGPANAPSVSIRPICALLVLLTNVFPWAARILIRPTYRMSLCNAMQHVADLSVFVTAVIALVTAGNPTAILASVARIVPPLGLFNGAALLILLLAAIVGAATHVWPTSEADVLDICVANSALLMALDAAQALQQEALFAPAEFFPKYKIKEIVALLKQYHGDFTAKLARARRGHERLPIVRFARRELALDPARAIELNTQRRDIAVSLLWTVEDTIEDLVHLYGALRHTLSAFDEEGGTQSERFQRMRECLRGLGRSLRQKAADRILMHPEKHMLIRKLLILRTLVGNEFINSTAQSRRFQPIPAKTVAVLPANVPGHVNPGVNGNGANNNSSGGFSGSAGGVMGSESGLVSVAARSASPGAAGPSPPSTAGSAYRNNSQRDHGDGELSLFVNSNNNNNNGSSGSVAVDDGSVGGRVGSAAGSQRHQQHQPQQPMEHKHAGAASPVAANGANDDDDDDGDEDEDGDDAAAVTVVASSVAGSSRPATAAATASRPGTAAAAATAAGSKASDKDDDDDEEDGEVDVAVNTGPGSGSGSAAGSAAGSRAGSRPGTAGLLAANNNGGSSSSRANSRPGTSGSANSRPGTSGSAAAAPPAAATDDGDDDDDENDEEEAEATGADAAAEAEAKPFSEDSNSDDDNVNAPLVSAAAPAADVDAEAEIDVDADEEED